MNNIKFVLSENKLLRLNDSGPKVVVLKKRLNFLGESLDTNKDVYDDQTMHAVKRYQTRIGDCANGIASLYVQSKLMEATKNFKLHKDTARKQK